MAVDEQDGAAALGELELGEGAELGAGDGVVVAVDVRQAVERPREPREAPAGQRELPGRRDMSDLLRGELDALLAQRRAASPVSAQRQEVE